MIKQVFIPLILVAIFITAVGLYVKRGGTLYTPAPTPGQNQKIIKVGVNEITVEVADTAESRARGLADRTSLSESNGMLFVFPAPDNRSSFWMKGMKIPLDIIWINDGKVIDIDKNVPAPTEGSIDSALPTYSAGAPFDYVLEVNSGYSDKNDIKIGDLVTLPAL